MAETRTLPANQLITGDIQTDIETASFEGTKQDIQRVLEDYDAREIMTLNGGTYYRIPRYNPSDPELVVVWQDGTAETKTFNEFMQNVGNGFMDNISYDQIIDRDIPAELQEEIYTQAGTNYHVTDIGSAVSILASGCIEPRNKTRARTNKGTGKAIFTSSLSPQTVYGDVTFEIDVDKMVSDGFTPPASKEKPVEEGEIKKAIAHKFEIVDYRVELESGISRDTVVFYESIPVDYLSINASSEVTQEIREQINELYENNEISETDYQKALSVLE